MVHNIITFIIFQNSTNNQSSLLFIFTTATCYEVLITMIEHLSINSAKKDLTCHESITIIIIIICLLHLIQ